MLSINAAFEELRQRVPSFPYEKRLSKIDTLRLAVAYIGLLQAILDSGMNEEGGSLPFLICSRFVRASVYVPLFVCLFVCLFV